MVLFEASCGLLQCIGVFSFSLSVIIISVTAAASPNPERLESHPAQGGTERTAIKYNVKHKPEMYLVAQNADKVRCTGGIWLVRPCL